ncbi:MAG: restriction endonuclease subunit M [Muribaculum sp.]|nr:restriction endonuclease subunit M [Muribaculum sp.]
MKDIYHDNIDISEKWLLENFPKAFEVLLQDHSSGENIYWATDMYSSRGDGFAFFDSITIEKIKNDEVIRPRVCKSEEERTRRVKEKAEVFTPAWICNVQNNLVDEAWFGRPDVFNRAVDGSHEWEISDRPIKFEEHKDSSSRSFKNYVIDRRLEITCGEAPYLVSRYDAVSGEIIPIEKRIGMLDRKLQAITQEIKMPDMWLEYAKEAVKSIYGFEWQGDSLLLAREAILLSVIEYFITAFPDEPGNIITTASFKQRINKLAHFISCNIWQMDGLNYVLPGTSKTPFRQQTIGVFAMSVDEEIEASRKEATEILSDLRNGRQPSTARGIPAVVYDWWDEKGKSKKEKQFFASLVNHD